MKKRILLAGTACLFVFASAMMSCGGSHEEQKPATDSSATSTTTTEGAATATTEGTATPAMYACEMKCEGGTSNEVGKCPKCGMEMKAVTTATK